MKLIYNEQDHRKKNLLCVLLRCKVVGLMLAGEEKKQTCTAVMMTTGQYH